MTPLPRGPGRGGPYPDSDKTVSEVGLVMYDIVQIAGSLLILVAFVSAQTGRLSPSSRGYLAANAAGSAVLAVIAVIGREWGFILLEGVWALVSIVGLTRSMAGKAPGALH